MVGPSKILELRGIRKYFGPVQAVNDVSFAIDEGAIVSILGPSGCGKTTILRLIAGFEAPEGGGDILIRGQSVRSRRPYERNIGLVFQDYALFPHMTVLQNIEFGPRERGVPRSEIPAKAERVLKLVKLTGYERRMPSQLSGGEQQRVALARALITDPVLLLLDEPLSNLDAKLREELRVELREILTEAGTTAVIVTHDQEEAMSLADNIIVMNKGRVVQRGTPREIYSNPRSRFVAEFVGRSNWFSGSLEEDGSSGLCKFRTEGGMLVTVQPPQELDGNPLHLGIRPERLLVHMNQSGDPESSERGVNWVTGVVEATEYLGSILHLWVKLCGGERLHIAEKNDGQPLPEMGQSVQIQFRADDCLLVPD